MLSSYDNLSLNQQSYSPTRAKIFLNKIGIYSNLVGYDYLLCAISETIKTPSLLKKLTTEMYPLVASNFGTTGKSVERGIRNAIKNSFERGRAKDVLNKEYSLNLSRYDCPTNGEFIAFIIDVVIGYDAYSFIK